METSNPAQPQPSSEGLPSTQDATIKDPGCRFAIDEEILFCVNETWSCGVVREVNQPLFTVQASLSSDNPFRPSLFSGEKHEVEGDKIMYPIAMQSFQCSLYKAFGVPGCLTSFRRLVTKDMDLILGQTMTSPEATATIADICRVPRGNSTYFDLVLALFDHNTKEMQKHKLANLKRWTILKEGNQSLFDKARALLGEEWANANQREELKPRAAKVIVPTCPQPKPKPKLEKKRATPASTRARPIREPLRKKPRKTQTAGPANTKPEEKKAKEEKTAPPPTVNTSLSDQIAVAVREVTEPLTTTLKLLLQHQQQQQQQQQQHHQQQQQLQQQLLQQFQQQHQAQTQISGCQSTHQGPQQSDGNMCLNSFPGRCACCRPARPSHHPFHYYG